MKPLQPILTVCLLISLSSAMLSAQPRGGMMMTPEERAKQLKERLSLTDEQTTKVMAIFETSLKQMMDKMPELMGDREAMRKAMTEMTAKNDKEIERLLTKEQAKKFAEFKKEREQMIQRRMQRRPDQ